ncbi:hypothetical protein [Frankia sp. QA3]|uniref:hypothetical protein n=1 Tax=Frankia sp. QA3 TaxID=710111 RepID=UPI000269BC48|nr:hypothetical protein [Frankia sp. QA3]EIV91769.1 hypothetical protein FraQA3DRAFT_1247 [Frankia sp. QA3]
MTGLSAGGRATLADGRAAQTTQRLFRDELARVRAAALAWRNALAGLLVGLVGFGLVRGRSDVGDLTAPWNAVVGFLLLAALLAGAGGALRLLSAAHGRPVVVARRTLGSELARTHAEAIRAAAALRQGIVLVFGCAALLVAAVAVTWYGPGRSQPRLVVALPAGQVCGEVVRVGSGRLTLRTNGGEVEVDLRAATGIRPVATCPPT